MLIIRFFTLARSPSYSHTYSGFFAGWLLTVLLLGAGLLGPLPTLLPYGAPIKTNYMVGYDHVVGLTDKF